MAKNWKSELVSTSTSQVLPSIAFMSSPTFPQLLAQILCFIQKIMANELDARLDRFLASEDDFWGVEKGG